MDRHHNKFWLINLFFDPLLFYNKLSSKFFSLLQNGVRGLMLDTYDFMNDIWLCHSFGGKCYNFTAFVSEKTLATSLVFSEYQKIEIKFSCFHFQNAIA